MDLPKQRGMTRAATDDLIQQLILHLASPGNFLVAATLGMMEPPAVSALMNALQDPNENVRAQAAEALGIAGSRAKMALPTLEECLGDSSGRVRQSVQKAIKSISTGEGQRIS
jgi:HEAT repeat protein